MVGYLHLACTGGASPWAASADEVACARLESLTLKKIAGIWSLLIILLIMLTLLMFLIILMFGRMVVLFLISYLVLGLAGVVTLCSLVLVGLVTGGSIWSYCLLMVILVLSAVSCLTRFVAFFSPFSVLSFGELSSLYNAPLLFIWELTCSSCFSDFGWSSCLQAL